MRGLAILILLVSGCTTTYTNNINVRVNDSKNVSIEVRNPNNPYYDGRRNY
jgi:hypothetical protein